MVIKSCWKLILGEVQLTQKELADKRIQTLQEACSKKTFAKKRGKWTLLTCCQIFLGELIELERRETALLERRKVN